VTTRNKGGTRPLSGAPAPAKPRTKPRVPDAHLATPTQILLDSPLTGVKRAADVDVDTDAKTLRALIPEAPVLPPAPVIPKRANTVEMISMKTPAELAAEKAKRKSAPVQVQLRSIAEAGRHNSAPPGAYGYLAPPSDAPRGLPAWVRYAAMAATSLAIAIVVALAIWFLAY
jgi:hypothetical protein